MRYLILHEDLEASNGGPNQSEIAEWIQKDKRFLDFVKKANLKPIPEDRDYIPTVEWLQAQSFNPNDLIEEACKDLGWHSAPDGLAIDMNFGRISYVQKRSKYND